MKKLLIIRHAQAHSANTYHDDYDRTLTQQGLQDTVNISQYLLSNQVLPDLIITSSAIRTFQTASSISNEMNYQGTIVKNQYIYEAYPNTLEEIVHYTEDKYNQLFLVGHNPGVSSLIYTLTEKQYHLPPCGMVQIYFQTDSWLSITKNNSKITFFHHPQLL